jgi:mannitol-1-/sugar-/sorbitol-6-phosphatase
VGLAAVLFDLDGVLIDSTASVERHWTMWAGEQGLDPAEVLATIHGKRTADSIRHLAPQLPAEEAASELERRQAQDTEGVTASPGAAELLGDLPSPAWAVVTSGTAPLARARLAAADLADPPCLICADDVTEGKPDPEGYLLAAARLGAPPLDCLVVEDTPSGVRAGKAAGMHVIAVLTTHQHAELIEADLCVPTLRAVAVELAAA